MWGSGRTRLSASSALLLLTFLPGCSQAQTQGGYGRILDPSLARTSAALFVTPEGHLRTRLELPHPDEVETQGVRPGVPGPGRSFLYSALIPGLGQRVQGHDRWIAYLAGEVWAWIRFLDHRREGHSLQRRYRELAWLVARRVSSGPRVDGDFEYYEAMTQFPSSGAFDANPDAAGVQPEEDPRTFNGSLWALAQDIFFLADSGDPVDETSEPYQDALRYYQSRAYTQDLAWNWGSNTLQQGEFRSLIRSSDENLRRATTMIGVILANHLLSAVDGLVSGRLGQVSSPESRLELALLPDPYRQDSFVLTFRLLPP